MRAELFARARLVRLHHAGPRPWPDRVEIDGPAAIRRGFDPQRHAGQPRVLALPGGAPVGGGKRIPRGCHRLESRSVEPRRGKERRPVGLARGRGRRVDLGWHGLKREEASARARLERHHAGFREGRIVRTHQARDQELVSEKVPGHEVPRALPVPEVHGRPSGRQRLPARSRGVSLLEKLEVLARGVEPLRRVGGLFGVAELAHDLLRPIHERVRGLLERDHLEQIGVAVGEHHEPEQHDDGDDHETSRPWSDRSPVSGGGDHFGRGRLAGGERGGERIASGQARRRRRRPSAAAPSGPSRGSAG